MKDVLLNRHPDPSKPIEGHVASKKRKKKKEEGKEWPTIDLTGTWGRAR